MRFRLFQWRPRATDSPSDVSTAVTAALQGAREAPARWAWWVLGAAVMAHLLMMGSLFWGYLDSLFLTTEFVPPGIDFFAIQEAGHRALEHRSVYEFAGPSVTPYFSPYRYVPFFAYAFGVPVSASPSWPAYWGWTAFNELLLVVNAYATWRLAGRRTWAVIAAAMWFAFTPLYVEQYTGQFTVLMATALFGTGVGILRGREAIGVFPWLTSIVIKSNSAVLAPLLLRLRWYRALIAAGLLAGLNGLYFISRPGDWPLFFRLNFTNLFVREASRHTYYNPADESGIALLRNSLMTLDADATNVPVAYTAALVIGVVGCSLLVTLFARKADPLALFAIWVSAFFLFYTVYDYHYVMLLPVLVLLVAFRPAIRPWALVAFVFVALPSPYWLFHHIWNPRPEPTEYFHLLAFLRDQQKDWPGWGVVLYHAMKPVPVFALWAYLVVSQLRQGVDVSYLYDAWVRVRDVVRPPALTKA